MSSEERRQRKGCEASAGGQSPSPGCAADAPSLGSRPTCFASGFLLGFRLTGACKRLLPNSHLSWWVFLALEKSHSVRERNRVLAGISLLLPCPLLSQMTCGTSSGWALAGGSGAARVHIQGWHIQGAHPRVAHWSPCGCGRTGCVLKAEPHFATQKPLAVRAEHLII